MNPLYSFFCILVSVVMVGCSSARKVNKSTRKEVGTEVVVAIPLTSENTMDTPTHFRAVANGTSLDWNTAKNMALTLCRSELALKLNAKVKSAAENYAKQYAANSDKNINRDFAQTFEQYTVVFTDAVLKGATEVENVSTRNTSTLEYTHWVALEISKDKAIEHAIESFNKLPAEVKARIDYDKEKFRAYLNESCFNE